ncbi:Sodium/hydrogen exchanger family-domain-containing protein [Dunaliella salina]|uniref:Sodium/hydrogen exchanger family-domain-containing protein n=1 Tax=Dunaliella salina TaxID=3046 RepID=A0ABQ7G2Y0_DUNSA|nr:Sodium/hydrogen exchanger family-domain-containing protein [Dunaliella salina]|eukprot:KAF5828963.1 Sodium/hydrogen exchanger family-domain-containing protein [Dunaliella salina]
MLHRFRQPAACEASSNSRGSSPSHSLPVLCGIPSLPQLQQHGRKPSRLTQCGAFATSSSLSRTSNIGTSNSGSLGGLRPSFSSRLRGHPSLSTHTQTSHNIPGPRKASSVVARASAASGIVPLGFDLLTFLACTVFTIPVFKRFKISPILGFLTAGVVLQQLNLIHDPEEMGELGELGVLFLLFEMGLELSIDRLKSLAKFAFGLGSLQVLVTTFIFSAAALPPGGGIFTRILEFVTNAPQELVSIRSIDEAVVIGAALSLSSSAFVLQLLNERAEMSTKFGSATLGILLLQDIAVVPLLVLLPLAVQLSSSQGLSADSPSPVSLLTLLGPTALKTCGALGLVLFSGRLVLRRMFEMVAKSDNSETFVGLCLLTVAGASLLTQRLGFSDTLGAFAAGVLLSESNFKTQILTENWQVIGMLLVGLLAVKTTVIASLGGQFGLTRSESIRTGFLLSQGGEFAFVLLSLANQLKVLPEELNQVLIIVVVMSMALTPGLAELGKVAGEALDRWLPEDKTALASVEGRVAFEVQEEEAMLRKRIEQPVAICGFGSHGQMLAALLDSPLESLPDTAVRQYIAFDLDPVRVQAARAAGFSVVYGDGSRSAVLQAAGVNNPRAIAVCLPGRSSAHQAVESLRQAFPTVPIYALAVNVREAAELEEAGADHTVIGATAAGLSLGCGMLERMGGSVSELQAMERSIEQAMELNNDLFKAKKDLFKPVDEKEPVRRPAQPPFAFPMGTQAATPSSMLEGPPSAAHELRQSAAAEWRRNISATASALLDCDGQEGGDCGQEVATIVVTDIQEQRRQQVCFWWREDGAASALVMGVQEQRQQHVREELRRGSSPGNNGSVDASASSSSGRTTSSGDSSSASNNGSFNGHITPTSLTNSSASLNGGSSSSSSDSNNGSTAEERTAERAK